MRKTQGGVNRTYPQTDGNFNPLMDTDTMLNEAQAASISLSPRELQQFNTFLTDHGMSTVFYFHGLSCGFGSSLPNFRMKMESIVDVLTQEARFTSLPAINEFASSLIRLQREVVDALQYQTTFMPLIDYHPVVSFQYDELTEDQKHHLSLWCLGYVLGLSHNQSWDRLVRTGPKSILLPIILLGDTTTLDALSPEEAPYTAQEKVQALNKATEVLPSTISVIYHRCQAQFNSDTRWVFKGRGRNDPCGCGSGKKFKKCCLSLSWDH